MCQVQTSPKKRSRNEALSVETMTKRAKQIALEDEIAFKPSSPVDVASDLEDSVSTSEPFAEVEADCVDLPILASEDLNLEVKLMQGAVNEMQATVSLAATRINELRELLKQYAESR